MGVNFKKGFTFIEMAVTIGILSFALPTLYTIIFLILQQQVKIVRLNIVKKESTYITDVITTLVRDNAVGIYSKLQDETTGVCSYNSAVKSYPNAPYTDTLYFKDKLNNWFNFNPSLSKISSESSILNATSDLNSPSVLIYGFTSRCSVNNFATPLVIFTYDICYNLGGSCGSEPSFHFQPTVKLRNY